MVKMSIGLPAAGTLGGAEGKGHVTGPHPLARVIGRVGRGW